ncbi:MAG: aminotransferase class IV [Nannocystaceae bacterium]|nr:aminotransferase class IV [bacterium]
MSSTKVYVSTLDAVVDPADAKVSVFDRGFLYGDSIYETMRTAGGGRPVELERHLQRLTRSGEGIFMDLPLTTDALGELIARTHAATGNDESYVRLMITRGAGPIGLDPRKSDAPTIVIVAQPLALPSEETYRRGLRTVLVHVDKAGGGLIDPGIKTGNYLSNIIALREAIAKGGDDALLVTSAGEVAEGATSNVFAVIEGELCTPHLRAGLLAGITRQVVRELAADIGHPAKECVVRPQALASASEVFLTSSVRGIMPVTAIDGTSVGAGEVGPVTTALRARYEAYIASYG